MDDEQISERLARLVEGEDETLDWAQEQFKQYLADIKAEDRVKVDDPDDKLAVTAALGEVREDLKVDSSFVGGEDESLPVLALGYSMFREEGYFVTDGDGLVCLGIVNPPEDPAGVTTIVLDSDHGVDLNHAMNVFDPLNTVRAAVRRSETDQISQKGGKPVYICNSTSDTTLEAVDPSEVDDDDPIAELPQGREPKREMIHEHFITEQDHVTLDTVPPHETTYNNNGFEAAFGADVKRFRGQVIDVYTNMDEGFGTMTLLDDTVTSPDEVSPELVSDQQRQPGLQVMMNPRLLQYGENSQLDVYGYIEQTDDGQFRMQGLGVIPLVEFEREFDGNGSDDSEHEETTI